VSYLRPGKRKKDSLAVWPKKAEEKKKSERGCSFSIKPRGGEGKENKKEEGKKKVGLGSLIASRSSFEMKKKKKQRLAETESLLGGREKKGCRQLAYTTFRREEKSNVLSTRLAEGKSTPGEPSRLQPKKDTPPERG